MATAVPALPTLPAVVAEAPRELKVRIPVALHLKLHACKVLRRQSMSETVEAAVVEFLQDGGK